MADPEITDSTRQTDSDSLSGAISIVQRGNLKALERTLRKQWRLGQNIVLCWSADERGLLVVFVPHYFLGNYCAVTERGEDEAADNETFVRELISGRRCKTRDELFAVSERLDVAPTFIKLNTRLAEDEEVLAAVEQLIKRYGISYVDSRAVLLLDIVEFSLYTPFEQASQLNSLSYSLNSAYNKLLAQGIEVNFSRTTTGDGYYIWNRNLGSAANEKLFFFMLLVVADNAVARTASRGHTVPLIRTGYHIGGHYELYQAEGVNPTVFSYIVGDVTIELARMLDRAEPGQILVGDFQTEPPSLAAVENSRTRAVSTASFVRACNRDLSTIHGTQLSGKAVNSISCSLSGGDAPAGEEVSPLRLHIVDKHGLSRDAYNLEICIDMDEQRLTLGLEEGQLTTATEPGEGPADKQATELGAIPEAPSADEMIDDLANLLKKHQPTTEND